MPKTRQQVIKRALQRLEVVGVDGTPTATQDQLVGETLDALIAELQLTHGMPATFDVEATPDAAYLPLAFLLAVDSGPDFLVQTEPRSRAMGRMRAYLHQDDRPTEEDYDEDGTVTEAETEAYERARFY